MPDINSISKDGFSLGDNQDEPLTSLALLSLRNALKSYFATYKSMAVEFHIFGPDYPWPEKIDDHYSIDYFELVTECILHFQHFAELVCKDLLRSEHQLLATDASRKPLLLHKLLKGERIKATELESLYSIGFSEALNRLDALIKARRLGVDSLQFMSDAKGTLEQLNVLRNRITHRGTFILRYQALDRFVGQFILPIVQSMLDLPQYSGKERLWKYKILKCGIDPISAICEEFKGGAYNLDKVAILKELGRAAYENPLYPRSRLNPSKGRLGTTGEHFNRKYARRAKSLTEAEETMESVDRVLDCPVCGLNSLVVYEDSDVDDYDPELGGYKSAYRFTYKVTCACCSFELYDGLKDPKQCGFMFGDYWTLEDLH